MAAFIASKIGKYVVAFGVVLMLISGAYFVGKRDQKAAELKTQFENSVKILRERGAIDDRVKGSSSDELCRALGGVLNDNGECL